MKQGCEKMEKIKFKVEYSEYDRYYDGKNKIVYIKSVNNYEALIYVFSKYIGLTVTKSETEELKEHNKTISEIKKSFFMCNGDGTNYVTKITNMKTNKVIFRDSYING